MRIVSLLLIGLLMASSAWANEGMFTTPEPEDLRAIHAIIGEAESEGYEGMYAVACAIRNRGTLKGVYGEHAPRVKKRLYSQNTYMMAENVWLTSGLGHEDITKGATNWENIRAFGEPYWAKSMIKTVRIGHHQFYRPKQRYRCFGSLEWLETHGGAIRGHSECVVGR